MAEYSDDELREALAPIASLISKSERAQQKLAPGTWQHAMLRDNIKALRLASALMRGAPGDAEPFTTDDLQAALVAFASMIDRTEAAHTRFTPGTSQHTLLRNRLKALRIAEATVAAAGRITPTRQGACEMASKEPDRPTEPVLLSGGNPQIAKGDGDAPVQAYIAAMPGWKSDVGRRLDALVTRTVPNVRKAVRWNSPFYGSEDQGWFLNVHCFTKYVKVTFFDGVSLDPPPPGKMKDENARYLNIYEDDELDEAQLTAWVMQASRLPGWRISG